VGAPGGGGWGGAGGGGAVEGEEAAGGAAEDGGEGRSAAFWHVDEVEEVGVELGGLGAGFAVGGHGLEG